LKTVFRKGKLI
jgi:hypothetical protein